MYDCNKCIQYKLLNKNEIKLKLNEILNKLDFIKMKLIKIQLNDYLTTNK